MRKALMMTMLFVAALPVVAEWIRIGETEDGVIYYDPAKIEKRANIRRVWTLQNLKHKAPDGVMSMRTVEEFDCKSYRFRGISGALYAKPMGKGSVIASIGNMSEWDHGPPGSAFAIIRNRVCAGELEGPGSN